jgi:hypothetical protein
MEYSELGRIGIKLPVIVEPLRTGIAFSMGIGPAQSCST